MVPIPSHGYAAASSKPEFSSFFLLLLALNVFLTSTSQQALFPLIAGRNPSLVWSNLTIIVTSSTQNLSFYVLHKYYAVRLESTGVATGPVTARGFG